MCYTRTESFFYIIFASLTLFTLNCTANIILIKNKSENPITVALMTYDGNEFKTSPIEVFDRQEDCYKLIDTPLIIPAGSLIKVNIEVPTTLHEILDEPPFEKTPETIPTYLCIKTKRYLREKERYQDATFNVINGPHESIVGIWAQKIVAHKVTAIATFGKNYSHQHLLIDENGSPSMSSAQ